MEELKAQWCADLEEILQCPVCLERPQGTIFQCKGGHHICHTCKIQIVICPMCQGSYNGSRSFLAEHLSAKLDEIKASILLPVKEIKLETISTQTENKIIIEEDVEEIPEVKLTEPLAAKGSFPCRIGKCTFEGPHGRMLNHLSYYHKDRLIESESLTGKEYSRQWEMDHLSNIAFDLAFYISKMGIFFLITSIDSSGDFIGNVQMVHNKNTAFTFKYKLEIKGNGRCCSFEDFPRTCRTLAEKSYQNSLHIASQDMQRLVSNKNKFTCIFTLTREEPKSEPKKND